VVAVLVLAAVFLATRPGHGSAAGARGAPSPRAGGGAGLPSTPSPAPAAPAAPAGTPPAAPADALRAFVESTPGAGTASGVVDEAGVPTALVEVTASPADERLDVVSLASGAAALEASLRLPPPPGALSDFRFLGAAPIVAADLTGDGWPDFLVLLNGAGSSVGVVVSDDGGPWRLVPTAAGDPTAVYVSRSPAIAGGQLTSTTCGGPACDPALTLIWHYVRTGGYLSSS
jgi:hypothetical protein